jgi:hypothetical protein
MTSLQPRLEHVTGSAEQLPADYDGVNRGASIIAGHSTAVVSAVRGMLPTVDRYGEERPSINRQASATDSASSPWSLPIHGEQSLLLVCLALPGCDAVPSLAPRFDRASKLPSGGAPSFLAERHE